MMSMKLLATWRLGAGAMALAAAVWAGQTGEPVPPASTPPDAPPEPDETVAESADRTAEVVGEAGIPLEVLRARGWLASDRPVLIRPEALLSPQENRLRLLERGRYGGLLGEAMATRQPWQLLNPLAPPEWGDGTRHLRVDPFTGRAEGVILFSIRLGGGGAAHSLARKIEAQRLVPARHPGERASSPEAPARPAGADAGN
ncbi:MAG: hypothetical protein D6766_12370 [Verrucomicrobia bacterium]|nr:MAG: hypothetical protein D6766_12370 [Verrucomicrobiota bacterium]